MDHIHVSSIYKNYVNIQWLYSYSNIEAVMIIVLIYKWVYIWRFYILHTCSYVTSCIANNIVESLYNYNL